MSDKPRKWSAVKPTPTKAILKEVSHWLLEPTRIQRRMIELFGIIGEPETEKRTTFEVFVGGDSMPEVAARMLTVAEKYDWTVTKHNADAIIEDCKLAYQELKHLIPVKDLRVTREAFDEGERMRLERQAEKSREMEKSNALAIENRTRLDTITPLGAKRVIFAEHDVDDCDIMTDYFASHTDQYAIIGFTFTQKEDFKALRAAAGNFEPTKNLGLQAPDSVEHRDNYSMGAGNYLKDGGNHSNGWRVRSHRLPIYNSAIDREILFAYTPPAEKVYPVGDTSDIVTVSRNIEKDGIELRFPNKPSDEIRSRLKSHGWRWSRFSSCWYKRYSQGEMNFATSLASDARPPGCAPATELVSLNPPEAECSCCPPDPDESIAKPVAQNQTDPTPAEEPAAPAEMQSWKTEFKAGREQSWGTNALRFATEKEAVEYGADLFSRWMGADEYRAAQSEDPVRNRWENGLMDVEEAPAPIPVDVDAWETCPVMA